MWTNSSDLFSQICSKVSNKLYFEEVMIKQQQFFDIQPYKIDKLYSEPAKKLYKQISFKYQVTKELMPHPNLWHQNQRKIFIWFVVCYFHQIGAQDPLQINVDWETFSQIFFSKSSSFLKFQFLNIIKLKKRIIWTLEQDNLLTNATEQQGIGKWNQISKALFFDSNGAVFKSPKHCRQRWLNHLDRNKNKGKWTDQEDYKILVYVKESGKKWSKIVQVLNHTRTEHMIKNRFNSLLTKNCKNKKQKQMETINKIIRTLEKTLTLSQASYGECRPQQNMGTNDAAQLQSKDQSQLSEQSVKNNMQQESQIIKIDKQEIQVKKLFKSKASFQTSCFETMTGWTSFSCAADNFLTKSQQQKLANNCYTQILAKKQNIKKSRDMKQNSIDENFRYEMQKIDSSFDIQRRFYKMKPVYIIQLNK